jgi:CHAT domain-containing protein
MLLSGLAVAGANRPADPFAPEDGILTAREVASLDLSGTALVVLSGCETGIGEVRSGQGVLGLRRAFAISGAQALVMTLWSVSDADAVPLMDGFYDRILRRRSLTPSEALREAQLDMLRDSRTATGEGRASIWAAWVASGR